MVNTVAHMVQDMELRTYIQEVVQEDEVVVFPIFGTVGLLRVYLLPFHKVFVRRDQLRNH
jgi:hypothetical protein